MIRVIIAFLATVITAVQSLLIYTEGKGVCFNNGCEIVESLTTVTPFLFNVVGCVFFLVIFWCLYLGRNGSEYWVKFARLLLLAGVVAEAVLVFFQHAIAQVFCSYCLVILSIIVLLNLLSGARQIFRGIVLFVSVLVACFSLQFGGGIAAQQPLSEGAIAILTAESDGPELTLFFSKSCPHCEKVIEYLKEDNSCSVSFNPVEEIDGFNYPGVEYSGAYNPGVNLGFMKNLGLTGIPVLLTKEDEQIKVISGGDRIQHYLEENCREAEVVEEVAGTDYSGSSAIEQTTYNAFRVPSGQLDDDCQLDTDCVDGEKSQSGEMSVQ